jgi:Sec-independent protein translocase protein TatA
LFLLIIILLIFGPDELPEVARRLGRYYRQLTEYKRYLDEEIRKGFLEGEMPSKGGKVGGSSSRSRGGDEDLEAIARELGIDPDGLSKEDLVREIREAIRVRREASLDDEGGET